MKTNQLFLYAVSSLALSYGNPAAAQEIQTPQPQARPGQIQPATADPNRYGGRITEIALDEDLIIIEGPRGQIGFRVDPKKTLGADGRPINLRQLSEGQEVALQFEETPLGVRLATSIKPAAPQQQQAQDPNRYAGRITEIALDENLIIIEGPRGQIGFRVEPKKTLGADGRPINLRQLKQGEQVVIQFQELRTGARVASSITTEAR
jgi:predicted RNA-binding protein